MILFPNYFYLWYYINKKHPGRFENVILISDRGYFTHMLVTFLIKHTIRFVICVRGIAAKLDESNKLAKKYSQV